MRKVIPLIAGCVITLSLGLSARAQFLQVPDLFCTFQKAVGGQHMQCVQTDVIYFDKNTSEFFGFELTVDAFLRTNGTTTETISPICSVDVQAFTAAGSYNGSAQIRTIVQSPPPTPTNWTPYTREIKNMYWTFDDNARRGKVCAREHFEMQNTVCGDITFR